MIKSWLSPENLSLIKIIQSIHQGSYKKDHQASIIGDSLAISLNKKIKLSEKVYDPIAFIYFLRSQTLAIGKKYNFLSYDATKMKKVFVNVTTKEKISVPAGTFNCYKIEPISGNNDPLFKNNGVYITIPYFTICVS